MHYHNTDIASCIVSNRVCAVVYMNCWSGMASSLHCMFDKTRNIVEHNGFLKKYFYS